LTYGTLSFMNFLILGTSGGESSSVYLVLAYIFILNFILTSAHIFILNFILTSMYLAIS